MRTASLLVAALMMFGCASSTPPLTPPTRPLLDASLAEPCTPIPRPLVSDYDEWLNWSLDLLQKYGVCAARHAKTVEAWPK
jgi:hypothetical protein